MSRKENRLWAEQKEAIAILAADPTVKTVDHPALPAMSHLFNMAIPTLFNAVTRHRALIVNEIRAQRAKEDALLASMTTAEPSKDAPAQATGTHGAQGKGK